MTYASPSDFAQGKRPRLPRVPTAPFAPANPSTTHSQLTGAETLTSQVQSVEQRVVQNRPNSDELARFRCKAEKQRKIKALLWAAFPAKSDHAVSQRAGRVMGRDPRTIRAWMAGRSDPGWDDWAVISVYATVEKAMQITFGGPL